LENETRSLVAELQSRAVSFKSEEQFKELEAKVSKLMLLANSNILRFIWSSSHEDENAFSRLVVRQRNKYLQPTKQLNY
jgi:hypothetical protein